MTRLLSALLAVLVLCAPAAAQVPLTINSGANVPGNCQVGGLYVKTGTNAGLYACLATDTWTAVGEVPHLVGQGLPVVTNTAANTCGTTAATIAASSTDTAGAITVGATSGTSCTVTFAAPYTSAPVCLAQNNTAGTVLAQPASTTTAVVIVGTFTAADVLTYMCLG